MSIRNAKPHETWIEQMQAKDEWMVGETIQQVFVNFLPALEWASNVMKPKDWIYNTFIMKDTKSEKPPLVGWTLSAHPVDNTDPALGLKTHVTMTLESMRYGVPDSRARHTASGVFKVFENGTIYGTASLKAGGTNILMYGLRFVDGELTWVKTGKSVWVAKNDIEEDTLPTCKLELAGAISAYFRNRGDSSNPEVRRISKEMRALVHKEGKGYEPLDAKDLYVFNALVESYRSELPDEMTFYDLKDDVEYLKGAYDFVKRLYELAPQ